MIVSKRLGPERFLKFILRLFQIRNVAEDASQGSRTVVPVVLRPSRSACARAASESGYR